MSKDGDQSTESVDHIEELTLRLEAIDLSTSVEVAKARLEAARADPERPTLREATDQFDLRTLPWLQRRNATPDGDAA